jgi:hypothetical protein
MLGDVTNAARRETKFVVLIGQQQQHQQQVEEMSQGEEGNTPQKLTLLEVVDKV